MAGTVLRDEADSTKGPAHLDVMRRQSDGSFAPETLEFETFTQAWAHVDVLRSNPRAVVMFSRQAETS